MKLKIDNAGALSKAIDLISELVSEVRLRVNEFGLSITAIDPANVAMINFRIPKSSFSEFETEKESLGVNLDSLKKILKRAGNNSSVILEKKEGMLEIIIEDKIRRSFKISLIEVEGEEIDFQSKIANMEFCSKIEITPADLIAAIEDCSVVADSCLYKIEEKKFIIEAKGMNSARTEFSGDEATIKGEDAKSKYSLEYLSKFMKGGKLCEKIVLEFANDHPLKLDLKTPVTEMNFILAPRVETD
ncbi:MAG: hypothetical protein ACOC1P_00930 [Minisyncoccales bacterium]